MTFCCTSSREAKRWKDLFLIEKRCRKVLEEWTLHTFGFDVKLDYERDNNIARIQAIENKEAMKTATFPNESAEGEMKVVVMDVKIAADELLVEDEDQSPPPSSSMLKSEVGNPHPQQIIETPSNDAPQQQIVHVGNNSISGYPITISSQQLQQLPQQVYHHQGGPIEIGTSGEGGMGEQVVYLGNYEDGGQQAYYILKSGDNEDIPVQLDYSSFINGEVGTSSDKVYYRIAPSETENPAQGTDGATDPLEIAPAPSVSPKLAAKRKAPAPKNEGSKSPKAKKPVQAKTPSKDPKSLADFDPNSVTTTSKLKKDTQAKSGESSTKSPLEFGLTLREKAEIYVRTKAKQAVRKVGTGYECTECVNGNYSYSSLENAITHSKTHFESKPYKCEFCEETFSIQRELLQHRKNTHPKSKGAEPKFPTKPLVMYSQQAAARNLSAGKTVVVRNLSTVTVTTPNIVNSNTKPVTSTVVQVPIKVTKSSAPKDPKKPFKCQVEGCIWAYATEAQLNWHYKAHSQARV